MKKIMIFALMVLAFCFSANAQIVVANNYDSPVSGTADVEEDDDLEFGLIGVGYYSFDGFDNWGLTFSRINPNGLGMELGFRMNFEEHGNFNSDLGINYSFKLLNNSGAKLFLTLAGGPSLRTQDQYNFEKYQWDSAKLKLDAFINARISACFDRIYLAAGYYYWAPEFKFSGDYKADGFNLTLGCTF